MWCVRQFMSVVFVFAFLVASDQVTGAESDENAALVYWQAFALLPAVDQDREQLVKEAATVKLDQRTEELVQASKNALVCMRRATSIPELDWGLEYSAGPHMLMPHLSKARQLARYACLHARQQLADGNPEGALQTIHNTFVLARRIGADGVEGKTRMLMTEAGVAADRIDAIVGATDALAKGGAIGALTDLLPG